MINKKPFFNKKIIITGHTGFKGSWLTLWLHKLGARVIGISKDIPTKPSHFTSLGISKFIKSYKMDINNTSKLIKIFKKHKPDFVFHLAAQSIVSKSYINPIETWKTNLMGTLNILECLRLIKNNCSAVIITSDKAYKNLEISRGYKENDLLGGIDPYGASKSAAEIVIQSHIKSFFSKNKNNVKISVARAGNVVGGGDWSKNRLVPDCMRSCLKNKKVLIRNPNSTRPWQHVLEVINGYLTLALNLKRKQKFHGEAFNFGPSLRTKKKVKDVVNKMKKNWNRLMWKEVKTKNFFENKLLQLDSRKSKKQLKWKSVLTFDETIELTVDWYKNFFEKKKSTIEKSLIQIEQYERKIRSLM
jgi:CDP-glucose 4,6-dehydratase